MCLYFGKNATILDWANIQCILLGKIHFVCCNNIQWINVKLKKYCIVVIFKKFHALNCLYHQHLPSGFSWSILSSLHHLIPNFPFQSILHVVAKLISWNVDLIVSLLCLPWFWGSPQLLQCSAGSFIWAARPNAFWHLPSLHFPGVPHGPLHLCSRHTDFVVVAPQLSHTDSHIFL